MTDKNTIKKPTMIFIVRVLFSLLCALLLWVYVTSSQGNNYSQTFSNVSVVYEGETSLRESRGLVVTERYTGTVLVLRLSTSKDTTLGERALISIELESVPAG